jgi:hypothetical protein
VTSSVPTISPAGRRLPRTWDPRLHGWTCIGSLNRSTPCRLIAASRGIISVGAALGRRPSAKSWSTASVQKQKLRVVNR